LLAWLDWGRGKKPEVWPGGPPVCTTLRPGTALSASGTVLYCWRSMFAAVITVTELAISFSGVGIVVGLTTMVGKICVPCWLSCALAVCRHAARALVAPSKRTYRPITHVPSFAFAHANASGEDEARCEERTGPQWGAVLCAECRGRLCPHGLRTGIAVTAAKDRSVWTPRPPVG